MQCRCRHSMAEQEFRCAKVRQKISESFRTVSGIEDFAVLRSSIENARKQRWNPLCTLRADAEQLITLLVTRVRLRIPDGSGRPPTPIRAEPPLRPPRPSAGNYSATRYGVHLPQEGWHLVSGLDSLGQQDGQDRTLGQFDRQAACKQFYRTWPLLWRRVRRRKRWSGRPAQRVHCRTRTEVGAPMKGELRRRLNWLVTKRQRWGILLRHIWGNLLRH